MFLNRGACHGQLAVGIVWQSSIFSLLWLGSIRTNLVCTWNNKNLNPLSRFWVFFFSFLLFFSSFITHYHGDLFPGMKRCRSSRICGTPDRPMQRTNGELNDSNPTIQVLERGQIKNTPSRLYKLDWNFNPIWIIGHYMVPILQDSNSKRSSRLKSESHRAIFAQIWSFFNAFVLLCFC